MKLNQNTLVYDAGKHHGLLYHTQYIMLIYTHKIMYFIYIHTDHVMNKPISNTETLQKTALLEYINPSIVSTV